MAETYHYYYFTDDLGAAQTSNLRELQQKLAEKSAAQLRVEAAVEDPKLGAHAFKAASMARMELDRREAEAAEARALKLARQTTRTTGILTIVAALLGAIGGAVLTALLS